MKKLTLVFPGSYMNCQEIEEDMREEYLAAMETGLYDIFLFNYDEWLAKDRFRSTYRDGIASVAIYRGWMLKPNEYKALYMILKDKGLNLVIDPVSYRSLHLFPNVYPHIKEDTAETMIFKHDCIDVEQIKRRFRRFMVKDSVKSVKGTGFPAYFDCTISQIEFDEWMQVFYEYRGDLLTGDICIKEYLDLMQYDGKTNEFRAFYANHQVISLSRNSNQPDYTGSPPARLVEKYKDLESPYYTVDFAELTDGTWKIIEAGDGGVSGLSPGQDFAAYYRALYHSLNCKE